MVRKIKETMPILEAQEKAGDLEIRQKHQALLAAYDQMQSVRDEIEQAHQAADDIGKFNVEFVQVYLPKRKQAEQRIETALDNWHRALAEYYERGQGQEVKPGKYQLRVEFTDRQGQTKKIKLETIKVTIKDQLDQATLEAKARLNVLKAGLHS
jgi:hypothetical protein